MTEAKQYIYCIIRYGEERAFPDVAPVGGGAGRVYTVPHGDLAVVVSDAAEEEYEGTRVNMLAHQRVQERVMQEFTILPVRFGTVASGITSTKDIRKLLDVRSQEFDRLLGEMGGKVELGLKALWKDQHVVFEEIAAHDVGIRRLRDALKGKPPAATRYERVRLGEMVNAALTRKRETEAAALLAALRPIAYRTAENVVIVDRMIVNAAFLVDRTREEEFDREVNRLDELVGPRVTFRYVGPVPPYNFVNIVVNWEGL